MTLIGLLLIVVAWIVQLRGKVTVLKKEFVGIYVLGVLLLAIDGFMAGLFEIALLNVASLVTALLVFSKIKKK